MNEYNDIIEGVGIASVCVMVGRMLKSVPAIPDWTIPIILPFVGAGAACLMEPPSGPVAIKGFLAGGNAVWMNQTFRQGKTGGETIFLKKDKNADNNHA
jgi:hypothetical protein